jgi:quercetin dioxygenase-like cupin family protein
MASPPLTGSSLIRGSANRRRRLHEAHPLLAACRHPAVRQCPRGCTEVEERQGTLVYQHELPNVPGKSIKGVLVEYGPGGYSPGHTHPKSAFIYATVLEGAIRSQVNDGPVTTYKAGQSFSELPGDRHSVSANASKTKPAKLLAVFVVDTNETELTTPFGN